MKGEFTFLGTGGSAGIPVIGCRCAVCTSTSPYNRRLRSAGLIQVEGKHFLIDAGPDLREQALTREINHLDGVLLTHAHADHTGGIDDLRSYYFLTHEKLPCALSSETFEEVKRRYHYMIQPHVTGKSLSAQLDFHVLSSDAGEFSIGGASFQFFSYYQVDMKVTGYRWGNFAYVSDIRQYSDEIFSHLKGVEVLVLSALRPVPTAMHFSVEEAIAFSRRVGARTTYLTHIAHDLEYAQTNALLPPDVRLSYDGLKISIHSS